jgi:predicted ATP-dependent protease
MFFKRAGSNGETVSTPPPAAAIPEERRQKPLAPSDLRRTFDAKKLGFKTTAEIKPAAALIGQERALKAIEFGTSIKAADFNVFVLGPRASGKTTAVKVHLAEVASAARAPDDWVYVNNFEDANRPKALRLPAGRARRLARAMIAALDELRGTLPAAFETEDYQARRRAIEEEFRSTQEQALEALNQKAAGQNIAILRTPMGFAMAPMHDGKVVKPEVFNALPERMRREVQERIEALQKELEETLAQVPKADKLRRTRIAELNEEVSRVAVRDALDEVKAAFSDLPPIGTHLADVERDLISYAGMFVVEGSEEGAALKAPLDTTRDPRFRRYMVNVMVGSEDGDGGAPVYEESNPTYANLLGRIEHIAQMGALLTDFLLIKPGALHRANGGYLLVDARKLLISPFAWEGLKRALKAGRIMVESPAETLGLISTQTVDPEPIPLEIKIVLLGERELYYLMSQLDSEFLRLFKVQADFNDTIARGKEDDSGYPGLVASVVATHNLKPIDAEGVARLIDEGARMASDKDRLSLEVGRIADLVREADHWATEAGRKVTGAEDVARAVEEQTRRASRLRDRVREAIERGIVLVDTDGAKVGQVNGLSVIDPGDLAFGRPSRITARVRLGPGRVTDIERESKLGGPLHSKGVMILWGYLAGRFAQDVPLALAASLVFEQSYAAVEGDSASSAELYALLSALAETPILQGLAVTGSVNQWGGLQAVGGVNEKIEGFFDLCEARGLSGKQGVVIPRANVQHLMLRPDIVAAAKDNWFAVYAASTIDQGIEILTGVAAGERGADGLFPAGTINRLVEDKLRLFADRARRFSGEKGEPNSGRGLS